MQGPPCWLAGGLAELSLLPGRKRGRRCCSLLLLLLLQPSSPSLEAGSRSRRSSADLPSLFPGQPLLRWAGALEDPWVGWFSIPGTHRGDPGLESGGTELPKLGKPLFSKRNRRNSLPLEHPENSGSNFSREGGSASGAVDAVEGGFQRHLLLWGSLGRGFGWGKKHS